MCNDEKKFITIEKLYKIRYDKNEVLVQIIMWI